MPSLYLNSMINSDSVIVMNGHRKSGFILIMRLEDFLLAYLLQHNLSPPPPQLHFFCRYCFVQFYIYIYGCRECLKLTFYGVCASSNATIGYLFFVFNAILNCASTSSLFVMYSMLCGRSCCVWILARILIYVCIR